MDKAYNGWANWETWNFIKDVREKTKLASYRNKSSTNWPGTGLSKIGT